jgi:hypothetical protein
LIREKQSGNWISRVNLDSNFPVLSFEHGNKVKGVAASPSKPRRPAAHSGPCVSGTAQSSVAFRALAMCGFITAAQRRSQRAVAEGMI